MYNIDINDLMNKKNVKIIDIRNNYKFFDGHIPGAINISEYELLMNPKKYLDMNFIYYIYCDYGTRAKYVVNKLNFMGYHTVNINGGYHNYLLWK